MTVTTPASARPDPGPTPDPNPAPDRGSTKRGIAIVTVIALLAAALGLWWWQRSRSAPEPAATTQQVVTVGTQTLSQSVSATGTINPKTQSNLRFTSAGKVTAVDVKVGDVVRVGQRLATIDPSDLQNALNLAQASVDSAQANLDTVRASSSATTAQINAANSQLAAAVAKRDTAKATLDAATMSSPIDGTVAAVAIAVGDQVTASGGGGSAGSGQSGAASASSTGQVTVITTDAWVVATSVTSADIASIKPGLAVQVTPTGARDRVSGTVATVGVVATTTGGVASFPVTVAVTGAPRGLYAGATAAVSILTREVPDAVVVPTTAIRTDNGRPAVLKVIGDQQVLTPVQIGMVSGQVTQIVSGLAAGDRIVLEGRAGAGFGGPQGSPTRSGGRPSGQGGSGGFPTGGGRGGASQAPPTGGAP